MIESNISINEVSKFQTIKQANFINSNSSNDLTWLMKIANHSLSLIENSNENFPMIQTYYKSASDAIYRGDIPSARWFLFMAFDYITSELLSKQTLQPSNQNTTQEYNIGKFINRLI